MDAGVYYFRKNLITGAVLLFFAIVMIILGSQLGYYQNAFQAYLCGIDTFQEAGTAPIPALENAMVNILMFIPVIAVAVGGAYNMELGKKIYFRLVLLLPAAVYAASVCLDWKDATPFSEKFKDIYSALDNVIYLPFILCLSMLVIYFCLVIIRPESMTTKVIGSITMIISICAYVIFGIYVIYLQALSALDGSFGMNHFILYLVSFGIDVALFFLMLSLVMSFSAMRREELLWENEMARRRRIEKARQSQPEEEYTYDADEVYAEDDAYDEDFDGYGAYMYVEEDDEYIVEEVKPVDTESAEPPEEVKPAARATARKTPDNEAAMPPEEVKPAARASTRKTPDKVAAKPPEEVKPATRASTRKTPDNEATKSPEDVKPAARASTRKTPDNETAKPSE